MLAEPATSGGIEQEDNEREVYFVGTEDGRKRASMLF
jgi:hypothetical protein